MTTWFLDIDGVVNVVPAPGAPHTRTWERWREVQVGIYPITYSPDLVEAIADLSRQVTVVWLTTWRRDAAESFAPAVGLPRFGWAEAEGLAFNWSREWWKCRAVIEHLEADVGEPCVWTDDDLEGEPEQAAQEAAARSGTSLLTLRPELELGLGPEHIEVVRQFVTDDRRQVG